MIPNRGAAVHKDAVKRCQGYRQSWNYCLFVDVLLHRVPPNFSKDLKGAANQKSLRNTALKALIIDMCQIMVPSNLIIKVKCDKI